MQLRSENQHSQAATRLSKQLAHRPEKRKSFVDLTNEKIKRICKESQCNPFKTATRTHYMTRSYTQKQKVEVITTKKSKSKSHGISVLKDADTADTEKAANDLPAPATRKQYMTRAYSRQMLAVETKNLKPKFCETEKQTRDFCETQNTNSNFCESISVFEDAEVSDTDVISDTDANSNTDEIAADTEIVVSTPQLPTSMRNFDNCSNPLQAHCYVNDLRKFFFERECKFLPRIQAIKEIQTDISHRNRALLMDWIIDVMEEFTLENETLFKTVNLIDRTLSKMFIPRARLQLLGVACAHLAAKYTEDRGTSPTAEEFAEITDNSFTAWEILKMERTVLRCLDFELTFPTAHSFLTRFLLCGPSSKKEGALAAYLSELFLMDLNVVKYKASVVAASALCLARLLLREKDEDQENEQPLWDKNMEFHTHLTLPELHECVQDMHRYHCKIQDMQHLQALNEKFSESRVAAKRDAMLMEPLTYLPFSEF